MEMRGAKFKRSEFDCLKNIPIEDHKKDNLGQKIKEQSRFTNETSGNVPRGIDSMELIDEKKFGEKFARKFWGS